MIFLALVTGVLGAPVICHAETELTPVYGTDVKDGTYSIEVESSSSMFRIVDAQLEVADGDMTAVLTLSGTGYLKLFMGTGEEALEAGEEAYIPFVENEEGAYTYTVPVEALDQEIDCAAYSKRKEQWYDRKLVFLASTLPEDALLVELPEVAEEPAADGNGTELPDEARTDDTDVSPAVIEAEDGEYTMEVTLAGGSGKATVQSPAVVRVSGQTAVAVIEWSSPNYDYMLVNGQKYLPVNTEGNSVFEIPVLLLDQEMPVTADTVAMSKPHEVEYTLTFHSDTLKSETDSNAAAILVAVVAAAAVIIVVAVVCVMRKKKARHA